MKKNQVMTQSQYKSAKKAHRASLHGYAGNDVKPRKDIKEKDSYREFVLSIGC